ncbi:MAG: DUF6062 family protein [Victivallales bacterium]
MKTEKNISHMHVLDAVEKSKDCPLCDLSNASVQKHFTDMLYESVNDRGLRKKLKEQKGFCAFHGELLLEHGDALGIAILHADQIQSLLDCLDNLGSVFSKIKRTDHSGWTDHSGCMICEVRKGAEKRHMENFIELMDDEAMRNYLEKFPGFCARHLFKVLEKLDKPDHVKYLLKLHKEKYKSLLADLKEFCRKNDYRFRDEASGRESDSWQKAVHVVSGKISS